MTPAMRAAIATVDPDQAAFGFMTLEALINSELSLNALSLRLLGSLGVVALLLAVIGAYGVTAQAVRQRTQEIAIRLALGVTPLAVERLLLRECSLLIAAAFLSGGGAALWAAGVLRSLVYGITRTSPSTFAAAAALLAAAVLVGCYIPARRAARTDPALVLRGE
jgi:putative ABC transport system permease protein